VIQHYQNKHLLGELTLGDLMETCEIEGDFSIGDNWLPIVRCLVSKKHKTLCVFMDSVDKDPDLEIPFESKVLVDGNVVRIRVSWGGYPEGREIRLRLDRVPDWL
jgi:hypothetical protein